MYRLQPWMQRAGEFPRSDREYFSLLVRAVFSAGLGPRVVESRWDGIRSALRDLDPAAVAEMDAADIGAFLADPGVIRNRRKAEAVVTNAAAFLEIVGEYGGFHTYLDRLKEEQDFVGMAESLSGRFVHLGRTSAGLFLFSAGWRGADFSALPATEQPAEEPAAADGAEQPAGGSGAAARDDEPGSRATDAASEPAPSPTRRRRAKTQRSTVAAAVAPAVAAESAGADLPAAAG